VNWDMGSSSVGGSAMGMDEGGGGSSGGAKGEGR